MTGSNPLPRCVLDCMYPFSQIPYLMSYSPNFFEAVFRAIWEAVSQATALSKPSNKTRTHSFMLYVCISADKYMHKLYTEVTPKYV